MSSYICQDLIVEIFIRLPPKSILRFRSVSKSLCSCIDGPDFIRLHMSQSPQKVLITHNVYDAHTYSYTLHSPEKLPLCRTNGYVGITPVEFPFKTFYILGSCNGILFVKCYDFERLLLWNPSIRRIVEIPDPDWSCGKGHDYITGFGFDPITNDYKIVRVSSKYERNSLVYTMKTGTWINIASPTTRFSPVVSRGSFVNGAFHWVVKRHIRDVADGICHQYIMTFDLSTHGFGTIDLPDPSWETNKLLLIINNSLAVISTKGNNTWIWVRREHNNIPSWSVHVKLKLYKYVTNWHITTTGNFLFYSFYQGYLVYNPETRKLSRLVEIGVSSYIATMETYAESLELLDRGTSCEGNLGTTTIEGNQPSFVEGKKRRRTTIRKLIEIFSHLCSRRYKKMC